MSDGFPSNPEKRKYRRLDAELPVRLEFKGQQIESTTENISCGGMFLPVHDHPLKEEETLTAFITIPEGSRVVRMAATVCRLKKSLEGDISGVAVKFSELYDDNHLTIDRFIKWKIPN